MQLEYLKAVRQSKKVKVQDLAKQIGVSREYMGRMERGLENPRLDIVEKWLEELGYQLTISIK